MPEEKKSDGPQEFSEDPYVARIRPDPSAPPPEVVTLEGLAGKSDREGWARLYFNRALTYYGEFRQEDVVYTEPIPEDQPPMYGLKGTRVGLRRDAVLEYTRTTKAQPAAGFDLDVRLGAAPSLQYPDGGSLWNTDCILCQRTDPQWNTCNTCQTHCNQATCNTCQTHCNQATCNTCQTHCNQYTCNYTCNTCQTHCNQYTCNYPCQTP
jgi:hypothetical protein